MKQEQDMVYQVRSKKSLAEIRRDLETASQKHRFGVLAVHDLQSKMLEKGITFDRECLVFEVCNPGQAKKVLEKNAEISTALPCRIAAFREGNEVVLATIPPSEMLRWFDASGLDSVAQEVEETVFAIMREAAE